VVQQLAVVLLVAGVLVACNAVPTAPDVRIVPADPTTGDDLTVEITGDATDNGRVLFYRTTWTRDGGHVLALDDETAVPAAETARDEVWTVEVSAVDDELDLGDPGTAQVTIANSPPTAQVSITPNPALVHQDLAASISTDDADDDPVEVTITWTVDGEIQPDLDDAVEVSAALTEIDQTWTVTVLPDDGADTGDAVSASVTIGADPRPPAFAFCAGGGRASNSTTSAVLCASPLDLATTPATNGKLVWYPGPIRALAP
jgi:hypothetical protein